MINMRDVLAEEARRQELVRQSALRRLSRRVPRHNTPLMISLRSWLFRLGKQTVALGERLQLRATTGRDGADMAP